MNPLDYLNQNIVLPDGTLYNSETENNPYVLPTVTTTANKDFTLSILVIIAFIFLSS